MGYLHQSMSRPRTRGFPLESECGKMIPHLGLNVGEDCEDRTARPVTHSRKYDGHKGIQHISTTIGHRDGHKVAKLLILIIAPTGSVLFGWRVRGRVHPNRSLSLRTIGSLTCVRRRFQKRPRDREEAGSQWEENLETK